jgi:hypothetical protein
VGVDPERSRILDFGQLVERRQGNVDDVSHAGDVHQNLIRGFRRETPGETADHQPGILAVKRKA